MVAVDVFIGVRVLVGVLVARRKAGTVNRFGDKKAIPIVNKTQHIPRIVIRGVSLVVFGGGISFFLIGISTLSSRKMGVLSLFDSFLTSSTGSGMGFSFTWHLIPSCIPITEAFCEHGDALTHHHRQDAQSKEYDARDADDDHQRKIP